jgi:3-phytase
MVLRAVALLSCATLTACSRAVAPDPDAINAPVKPRVVTASLPHDTDDPAIWINRADPAKSLVIGTDKDTAGGLYAFDLAGKIVGRTPSLQRPNNVDIITGVMLGGKPTDIAVTTEREAQRLRVFRLPDLAPLDHGDLVVFDGDRTRGPMGIALCRRPGDGAVFAIVGGKSGPADGYLWQYRLEDDGTGKVKMTKVRAFGRYSGKKEIEAIAVDAELGYIYYSDEQQGVHKYRADPDSTDSNHELALFGTTGFASDLEGISIYPRPGGAGYVVVSNQQADTFRIFPRAGAPGKPHEHPLLASVRLSTHESDGSDVTPVELPGFPGGLFVAMSTDRTFQFYAWDDIAAAAKLKP